MSTIFFLELENESVNCSGEFSAIVPDGEAKQMGVIIFTGEKGFQQGRFNEGN